MTSGRTDRVLIALTGLFAVVVPLGVVAGFRGQLERTGSVSHWPWEEHGVLGWWLVPLSLWVAAVCSGARSGPAARGVLTRVLVVLAAVTSLSLLYNP